MSAEGQGAPSVGGTRAPPPHLRIERGGSRETERDRQGGDIPQAVTPRTRRPAEAEREARGGFGGRGAPAEVFPLALCLTMPSYTMRQPRETPAGWR